jgi:hypothetical protein
VAKLPARPSPRRPLASPTHPLVVSRSRTGTSLVPSLSVRFVVTRSRPSSSSESFRSSVSFVRLLRTSNPTSASSHLPLVLFRNPLRLISSPSSRIPICAPSMPSVSLSVSLVYCPLFASRSDCTQSPRTSSLPAASVVSALKWELIPSTC